MMDRARLMLGAEPGKALALMRESLPVSLGTQDPALICTIRMRLGEMTAGSPEGEGFYRAALAGAESQPDRYFLAWAYMGLGYNRAKAARFDEAIPFFDQARKYAGQRGAKALTAGTLGNLGWCYSSLGDLDRAMDAYSQAEKLCASIGLRDTDARWMTALGNILLERGDFAQALDYQQRALDIFQDVGNDPWKAKVLNNLAEISIKRRDLAAAQVFNDRAVAIKRRLGDKGALTYSEWNGARIELAARKFDAAEAGYKAAIRDALDPSAHTPQMLWAAYNGLAVVYQRTNRLKLADEQYRKSIDTIDREWNKLTADDLKTTYLAPSYLIGLFQDYVGFLTGTGRNDRALEIAESARARVLSQKLQRAEALPPNLRIDRLLAAARATHTVILSYWLAPGQSSLWLIGPGRPSYHALASADEIDAMVQQHTDTVTQGRDPLAQAAASSALYQAVLAPVAKLIPPGSNVIVVPDGSLHQLNFETLVVPGPQPHYWIDDVTIATAPSLRLLEASPHKRAGPAKLLVVGDPILIGPEFGPLPSAKDEITAVADLFPSEGRILLVREHALPSQCTRALSGGFTHIHFATHATANLESPLNSAIVLSHEGENFKLYARDVANTRLRAELVTLSACKSAGAKAYSGEGLMGFAWAFLQAGAQNVIATLWEQDDTVSPALMRGLYKEIAAGQSPARALRSSKLALLHSAGSSRLPYYWGPLQVFTRELAPAKPVPAACPGNERVSPRRPHSAIRAAA